MANLYSELEPKSIFGYFALLSGVPHGSGNTGMIADICEKFAADRGLRCVRDSLNNVVIYKDGTAGYEDHPPVIIQGHLDMVCAQDESCGKDMKKEGLDLRTDGEYLWAEGTSLGGDDCIAVATAMAILDSDGIPHPPLECVFTVDEEVGMDGAVGLDYSLLNGKTMINLDSEDEGVFTVGCAGGVRLNFSAAAEREEIDTECCVRKKIVISGLKGGHSGAEINCGRANANQLLARLITMLDGSVVGDDIGICEMRGGKFDNVITNRAEADIIISPVMTDDFERIVAAAGKIIAEEYKYTDPGITVTVEDSGSDLMPLKSTDAVKCLFSLPQGVQKMSAEMPGLVETSCNLGVVNFGADGLRFSVSVRSSVESEKKELSSKIRCIAEKYGFDIRETGDYPGWKYEPVSPVRDLFAETYRELSGKDARVEAIHAGLECGFFASKIKGLDCVSLGPNLRDIHTSRERLEVASVGRMYKLVTEVLKKM